MQTQTHQTPGFSRLRRALWPIHSSELKKFLPMALMMFFILFNYTILRNTKDSLIIPVSGPEIIPFLKAFVILPFSILMVATYAKLSNVLSKEKLFYATVGTFLSIFLLFILYLYPNRDVIHMSPETVARLQKTYPYVQHIFPLVGYWSCSLFYLFAELWGATILSLSFWQFANEITRIHEARRFYAMFGFLGHFALVAAGSFGKKLCKLQSAPGISGDGFYNFMVYVVMAVVVSGICIVFIFRWINRNVLTDKNFYDSYDTIGSTKEEKPKMSLTESFKHILSSKYLGYIAVLVLGYGICMNLTGIMWKKQVQMQFPTGLEYAHFMSNFSMVIGVLTIILIFVLKGVVERFGWYKGAMVTPGVLLVTTIPFFALIFFQKETAHMVSWMGVTPLMTAVLIGAAQQIICKSSKYSMFDPTKEMAYIPLDQELKVKGKAAVDVTGYSFAKACGGYISGGLLILFAAADLMVVAPYLAVVTLGVIVFWCYAVKQLSILYYRLINKSPNPEDRQQSHPSVLTKAEA